MDRDPFDLVGDVLDGQFRVEELAGEGDLSVVYRGRQLGVDLPVAIKCLDLPETLDPARIAPLVTRFREGSRVHHRLARGHPNIAQVIASGSTVAPRTGAPVPYLVREWFDGESLGAELARRRTEGRSGRSVQEAIALLGPAVEGVAHAHAQGVFHLSFNPSNLFLANRSSRPAGPPPRQPPAAGADGGEPGTGVPPSLKVVDFGVARMLNEVAPDVSPEERMAAGMRALFPQYAAPEQLDAAAGKVGAWTDVYAIALVLMEVISDRAVARPARGDPTPAGHGIEVPRNLEIVLSRALARTPQRRQRNARDLWNDVTTAARRGASGALAPKVPVVVGAVPSKRTLAPTTPRSVGTVPMSFEPPASAPMVAAARATPVDASATAPASPPVYSPPSLPPSAVEAPVLPPVIVAPDPVWGAGGPVAVPPSPPGASPGVSLVAPAAVAVPVPPPGALRRRLPPIAFVAVACAAVSLVLVLVVAVVALRQPGAPPTPAPSSGSGGAPGAVSAPAPAPESARASSPESAPASTPAPTPASAPSPGPRIHPPPHPRAAPARRAP